MARNRYKIYDDGYPHFVTCTVVDWLPVFTRRAATKVILDSLSFLQSKKDTTLFAYVILENHLHLIAAGDDLSKHVGEFKSYTARQLIDLLRATNAQSLLRQFASSKLKHKTDRKFQFWQEGSHPKQITSDEMMEQKIEYIHYNPVKRGYVDEPTHWRYSSARNYAGLPGLIPVVTEW